MDMVIIVLSCTGVISHAIHKSLQKSTRKKIRTTKDCTTKSNNTKHLPQSHIISVTCRLRLRLDREIPKINNNDNGNSNNNNDNYYNNNNTFNFHVFSICTSKKNYFTIQSK